MQTTSKPKRTSNPDHWSFIGLAVVIVLTNLWFFSQVLTYAQ
jgi:hypothetical protein